tara:strand:+ start:279 stop:572 length:294 start_codon:yes stop_codon:yes gene_type:complete
MNDIKKVRLEILQKIAKQEITPEEGEKELLFLFSVMISKANKVNSGFWNSETNGYQLAIDDMNMDKSEIDDIAFIFYRRGFRRGFDIRSKRSKKYSS